MTFIPFIATQAPTGSGLTHNGGMRVIHWARQKFWRRKHSFEIQRLIAAPAPPARCVRVAIAAFSERTEVAHCEIGLAAIETILRRKTPTALAGVALTGGQDRDDYRDPNANKGELIHCQYPPKSIVTERSVAKKGARRSVGCRCSDLGFKGRAC
jgi:hypothetical protein